MGSAYDPTPKTDDPDERPLREALGTRLRHIRKQNNMTMMVLSHRADCSQSFISKVENGGIIPSLPMLQRLARALGVQPSSLLDDDVQSLGDQAAGRPIVTAQEP